ncbi:MAG: tetratricopeptide repeat protein [Bacteroidales bacterium]
MKTNNLHIDIKRYLTGHMTASERNAFEQRMAGDDFLRESVEGYREMQTTPDDLNALKPPHTGKGKASKTIFWSVSAIAASLALILVFNLLTNKSENRYAPGEISQISFENVIKPVIIRPESDTIRDDEEKSLHIPESGNKDSFVARNGGEQEKLIPLFRLAPQKIDADPDQPDGKNWHTISNHLYGWVNGYKVVDYRVDMRKNKTDFTIPSMTNRNHAEYLPETGENMGYFDFLAGALDKYDAGDFRNALYDFRIILNQYPDDLNAIFYAGLCHYHTGNYDKSIRVMERVAEHSITTFDQDALWYQAMAYSEQEYKDTCLALLEKIAAENNHYGAKAVDLLEKIKELKK